MTDTSLSVLRQVVSNVRDLKTELAQITPAAGRTVRDAIQADPDCTEITLFHDGRTGTWLAAPVGGEFTVRDVAASADSPEAALAACLALEV